MPDASEPGTQARNSGMIGWLGFFLLVFAVAGFAFYLAGDSRNAGDSATPAATAQSQ